MNVPHDRVAIEEFTIIDSSGNKRASLAYQLMSFTIEEDITSPFVEAQINVLDGIGLISTFPIIGEEKIQISITKYIGNQKETMEYTLFVYAVENLTVHTQNTVQAYVLRAVSEEVLISGSKLSKKAYRDSYQNIVRDILTTDIGTTKPINAASTFGTHQIVIPYKKPFAAIDMVRKRATSIRNAYSPMMFFETKNGYFFNDVSSIFQERKPNAYKLQYYNTTITNKDINEDAYSIISFTSPEKHNSFDVINSGAIKNVIQQFDLITKTIVDYPFDLKSKMSSFNFFNGEKSRSSAFVSKYTSNNPAITHFVPVDSTKPNVFIDQFGERQSYLSLIMQNYSKLETIGSLNMQAGDVVDLRFNMQSIVIDPQDVARTGRMGPHGLEKNNERNPDESVNGLYMIKKIIHEVVMAGSGPPTYRTFCDLIRGSTIGKLT
jgi:hypothetical protein